jgi:type III pantothenate kinase
MLLCDIGNTSFHFYYQEKNYKKSVKDFEPSSVLEEVFYICVNPQVAKTLEALPNWKNLANHIDMSNYYESMGVDRIVACEAVQNALIIDAGSAITVDIVKNGVFMGGFIYPGVNAMQETYTRVSSRLEYPFNFDLDLQVMPKNSQDAISYGFLKTLHSEVMRHELDICITGGDAQLFAKIFPLAELDELLIFKGMQKILKKL